MRFFYEQNFNYTETIKTLKYLDSIAPYLKCQRDDNQETALSLAKQEETIGYLKKELKMNNSLICAE